MSRLIKRYGNRKLYDTQTSRYVTLDGIAELVRAGDDLRILDNDSGEDLTAVTFAQIIFEEEKRKPGLLELPVLRWMIQRGGATVHDILTSMDRGREALESMRDGVKQLLQGPEAPPAAPAARSGRRTAAGKADEAPGRRLLDEILETPQKQLEQLQHRIDAQVRASIERVTAHPAFQNELRRIEEAIKNLERQLGRLRRRQRSAAAPPRATAKRGHRDSRR